MYPEIQTLRDLVTRRYRIRREITDLFLFFVLPLAVGFTIEGFLL